ncbi:hypothetical protein FBQ82_00905 [Anaerolineae bacterium CFX7]|nr:hypothetical protein [Anaerolineae bacterium CFX7]
MRRVQEVKRNIAAVDALLEQVEPRAILMQSDIGRVTKVLAAGAGMRGIPMLLVPAVASMITSRDILNGVTIESADSGNRFRCKSARAPLLNRIIAYLWPKVTFEHNGEKYLNTNAMQIIIEKMLRVYPDSPWHLGGAKGSYIAVGSATDWKRYLGYGIEQDRLILTGQVVHDRIFQARQGKKEKRSSRSPLILYGASPLPESNHISWELHRRIMKSVIDHLRAVPCDLRFCLHPHFDPGPYLEFAREVGITVEPRPLIKVLPDADAYLTWYSSTMPWAVMLDIPVINLDIYDMIDLKFTATSDSIDYTSIGGVMNIKTLGEMVSVLKQALYDELFRKDLARRREEYVRENAILDGKAGERLVSVVEDMIAGRNPQLAGRLPVRFANV